MDQIERVERYLKLHDMRILMAVVQTGSMSNAAEYLGTSQPAISRVITSLEQALGVRLLDRTPRGVEATMYGRALLKRSLAAFDELKQGIRDVRFLANPATGELRIGCSETMAAGPVLRVIDQITQQHPGVAFQIINGGAQMLRRELAERNIELMISWLTEPVHDHNIVAETLFEDSVVIAGHEQNPWTRQRSVKLKELVDEPWTLPPEGNFVTAIVMDGFRARGLSLPRANIVTQSLHVRNQLLATGRFLTAIGGFAFPPLGNSPTLKIVPVDLPNSKGSISLVTLRNRALSPLAEIFIRNFQATIKPALRKKLL